MNNRTRQWFKANQMLDKHDPVVVMAFMKNKDESNGIRVLHIIRKSEIDAAKEKYGDDLEVMY